MQGGGYLKFMLLMFLKYKNKILKLKKENQCSPRLGYADILTIKTRTNNRRPLLAGSSDGTFIKLPVLDVSHDHNEIINIVKRK